MRRGVHFIAVAMIVQILSSVVFNLLIVFRAMENNYEAIVNMTAVAKQYGAAHHAFIVSL